MMAVYRVDLLTNEPKTVFAWIEKNIEKSSVIRKIAYKTVKGWYMKLVFRHQVDAEKFHEKWYPEDSDHTVASWR